VKSVRDSTTGTEPGRGRVPLVGVTTYYPEAHWGPWRRPAALVPSGYFELVAAAGGRPLLVPPMRQAPGGPATGVAEVVAALDALVLIGGGDLDPASYGQTAHPETTGVDDARDSAEFGLLEEALAANLPVLAICRGLQVLNVHLGGTLLQDLPQLLGHRGHQPAPGAFDDIAIETVPGSTLAKIVGDRDTVRCSHHQAIDRLGTGLRVSAYAAGLGGTTPRMVEAVELDGAQFVLGVQWHPEESGDGRLFEALVAASGTSAR
jgi:putative glutamine amidotransferase